MHVAPCDWLVSFARYVPGSTTTLIRMNEWVATCIRSRNIQECVPAGVIVGSILDLKVSSLVHWHTLCHEGVWYWLIWHRSFTWMQETSSNTCCRYISDVAHNQQRIGLVAKTPVATQVLVDTHGSDARIVWGLKKGLWSSFLSESIKVHNRYRTLSLLEYH